MNVSGSYRLIYLPVYKISASYTSTCSNYILSFRSLSAITHIKHVLHYLRFFNRSKIHRCFCKKTPEDNGRESSESYDGDEDKTQTYENIKKSSQHEIINPIQKKGIHPLHGIRSRRSLSPLQRLASVVPQDAWEEAAVGMKEQVKVTSKQSFIKDDIELTVFNEKRLPHKHSEISHTTMEQFLKSLKRSPVVTTPKVQHQIFHNLGVQKGQTVLEAGSGTGLSAVMLSSLVGSEGFVYSVEIQKLTSDTAHRRMTMWGKIYHEHTGMPWQNNTSFLCGDVNNLTVLNEVPYVDIVYLDVPAPWAIVQTVLKKLKSGGVLGIYTPNVSHLTHVIAQIKKHDLPVILEDVWEETDRDWHMMNIRGEHQENTFPKLGWLENQEIKTAFVAKIRRLEAVPVVVNPELIKSLQKKGIWKKADTGIVDKDCAKSSQRFKEGEKVMLTSTWQRKKKEKHSVIVELDTTQSFYSSWGKITHSEMIGQMEGKLLYTSANQEIYLSRPTLSNVIQHLPSGQRSWPTARHCSSLAWALGLFPGDTVLTVTSHPAILPFLSMSVQSHGKVYAITPVREPSENVEIPSSWDSHNSDQLWPHNISYHSYCQDSNPMDDFISLNPGLYDGACLVVPDPLPWLHVVGEKVKPGRGIFVALRQRVYFLIKISFVISKK